MKHLSLLAALLIALVPATLLASSVTISADGSTGPVVTVTVGSPVTFAANVLCDDDLQVVPGTVQPKNGGTSSEVEYSFTNTTASTIRLTGFGISWNCTVDPGNDCDTWSFDYIKFGNPVTGAKKIYDSACYDVGNTFPVTDFDRNVGNGAYANQFIDIAAGATIDIKEFEFVTPNPGCNKIDPVTPSTEVEFTVNWRDDVGTIYPQVFTVVW